MAHPDTVFGKIVRGEIPCKKAYEDSQILAFHDIRPQAKVHVVIIPKSAHLRHLQDATTADAALLGHLFSTVPVIAAELGLAEGGYRILSNCGANSGQEVPHLHVHLLGGEPLGPLNARR
jgi:histidine triad (HIT) family protein